MPFEPFSPHPLLKNGHLQTLAAAWLSEQGYSGSTAVQHQLTLSDGDRIVIHDDRPAAWEASHPVAVLLHGLCGSAASPYMFRIADKLNRQGVRTLRMEMRGCGAGHGLAMHPYHAGRSDDLAAVVGFAGELAPRSSVSVAGFSLGGNVLLKWLGESGERLPSHVTRAVAVNPPVELQVCTNHLLSFWGGFYDRHFARLLYQQISSTPHWRDSLPVEWSRRRPRRLIDFDDQFTAPRAGFESAGDYYHRCSAARVIDSIPIPTLVISSHDDPLIPATVLQDRNWPACVRLHIAPSGGHLGYIGRGAGQDPDRNWMDWRVIDWLTSAD